MEAALNKENKKLNYSSFLTYLNNCEYKKAIIHFYSFQSVAKFSLRDDMHHFSF